jgi:S-adenosylmethionine decarboxylase
MTYQPGLHILARIYTHETKLLMDESLAKAFYDKLIPELDLQKVGEVYHRFPNGSFTGVICLTESHLSVHTWQELNMLTFDVYLSNYLRNNEDKTRKIFEETLAYFKAFEYVVEEVKR